MIKNIADVQDGDKLAGGFTAKRAGADVEFWKRGILFGVASPAADGSGVLTLED